MGGPPSVGLALLSQLALYLWQTKNAQLVQMAASPCIGLDIIL